MLHATAQERYEKLKITYRRLGAHFNRHDLDDFIATANSLREWVRTDPAMSAEQKAALERFVVPESLDWTICNEIANSQKHARPQTRAGARPLVKAVTKSPTGLGFAVPPSMRVFGAGEEISIECDGRTESALAFVVRTFRHFHFIFELAPIPPAQRDLQKMSAFVEMFG
jgi:hypothetical protein